MINLGFVIQLNGQQIQQSEERLYFKDSRIVHDSVSYQSYSVKAGAFTVFQLISDNSGEPGNSSIAESVLAFQVESGLSSFEIAGEELSAHQAIYIQRCRCQDRGIQWITSGQIKGEMLPDGNWRIKGKVTAKGSLTGKTYDLSVKGDYKAGEAWGE